jgi:hypothetical protein
LKSHLSVYPSTPATLASTIGTGVRCFRARLVNFSPAPVPPSGPTMNADTVALQLAGTWSVDGTVSGESEHEELRLWFDASGQLQGCDATAKSPTGTAHGAPPADAAFEVRDCVMEGRVVSFRQDYFNDERTAVVHTTQWHANLDILPEDGGVMLQAGRWSGAVVGEFRAERVRADPAAAEQQLRAARFVSRGLVERLARSTEELAQSAEAMEEMRAEAAAAVRERQEVLDYYSAAGREQGWSGAALLAEMQRLRNQLNQGGAARNDKLLAALSEGRAEKELTHRMQWGIAVDNITQLAAQLAALRHGGAAAAAAVREEEEQGCVFSSGGATPSCSRPMCT